MDTPNKRMSCEGYRRLTSCMSTEPVYNPGPPRRSNFRQQQQTTIAEYYSADAAASTGRSSIGGDGGRIPRAIRSSAPGRNATATSNSFPTASNDDDLFDDFDMSDVSDAPNSSSNTFEVPLTTKQPLMMARRGVSFHRGRSGMNTKPLRLPFPSQRKRPAMHNKNWSSFEENLASDDFDDYEWDEAATPRKAGYFEGAQRGGTPKNPLETEEVSKYPTYSNETFEPRLASRRGNYPRVFTVSVSKLQTLIKNKNPLPGEVIYQVFGILDSGIQESPSGAKNFFLKDQKKGAVKCIFYEMDRPLAIGSKGEWQRCVGLLKEDGRLQCLNVRTATNDELRVLDTMLCVSSREIALTLRSK